MVAIKNVVSALLLTTAASALAVVEKRANFDIIHQDLTDIASQIKRTSVAIHNWNGDKIYEAAPILYSVGILRAAIARGTFDSCETPNAPFSFPEEIVQIDRGVEAITVSAKLLFDNFLSRKADFSRHQYGM